VTQSFVPNFQATYWATYEAWSEMGATGLENMCLNINMLSINRKVFNRCTPHFYAKDSRTSDNPDHQPEFILSAMH
jgi:hypothetical protein